MQVSPDPPNLDEITKFRDLANGKSRVSTLPELSEFLSLTQRISEHVLTKKVVEFSRKLREHPRHGAPWDTAELRELEDEILSGMPLRRIAEKHKRSEGAIRSKVAHLVSDGQVSANEVPWLGHDSAAEADEASVIFDF